MLDADLSFNLQLSDFKTFFFSMPGYDEGYSGRGISSFISVMTRAL